MISLLHKAKLILAGVLVAAGAGAIAQIGGGSGTSAPPLAVASGSFTATYTGFTSSVTATAQYRKVGGIVVLNLPPRGGISNATTFTITGLPASIAPAATIEAVAAVADNSGTSQPGRVRLTSGTTTVKLYPAMSGGSSSWTATNTKALNASVWLAYEADD